MSSENRYYASLPTRIKASTLDFVIIVMWILFIPLVITMQGSAFNALRAFLILGVTLLYEPVMVSIFSATLGHKILGLKVVDENTDMRLSFSTAFLRWLGKSILGPFSMIYMFFGRKHQMIHDKLTKSMVIIDPDYLRKNPNASSRGEKELLINDGYAYPPVWRRLLFFVLWYLISFIPTVILYLFLIELLGLSDTQNRMEEAQTDALSSLISFAQIIIVGMLAAQGKLPGARRSLMELDLLKPDQSH